MELVNTNDENSFDLTSKLKSSPVPILFVSFNEDDENCIYCEDKYTTTICSQKYCKKCLSSYINEITDNKIYLDVYLFTNNLECSEHQECYINCLEILCFKQIPKWSISSSISYYNSYNNVTKSDCKLCGKSLYQGTDKFIMSRFKLCSDCYLISTGCIESTFTKRPIPIIYLPWWCNISSCSTCGSKLKFTSDYQKYCSYCLIFYTGCRYCLTT